MERTRAAAILVAPGLIHGGTLSDALHTAAAGVDPQRTEGLAILCSFNAYGAA